MNSTPTPAASRAEPTPAALAAANFIVELLEAKGIWSPPTEVDREMTVKLLGFHIDNQTNLPALLADKRRLDELEKHQWDLHCNALGKWTLTPWNVPPFHGETINGASARFIIDAAASKAP